ncbi:MAG: hypothetical protein IKN43_06740 [Selenomonadaceae bacterium]|nr:hypothetical protein [Selenomonadaceae bacterium]
MRENGKIQSDEVISSEKFNMPLAKIKDFLLKPGAKHSRDFFDVGYVQNDIVKLMRDIEFLFNEDNAEDNKTFPDGMERFSIFMDLGVNVKKDLEPYGNGIIKILGRDLLRRIGSENHV